MLDWINFFVYCVKVDIILNASDRQVGIYEM